MYFILYCIISGLLVSAQDFQSLHTLVEQQISNKVFPGAVIGIYYQDFEYIFKYGNTEYEGDPEIQPMLKTSMFDLASVSKVVGCTAAAMSLWESNKLDVDQYVAAYIPDFKHKEVTIRHLLLHNSGLPPGAPLGNEMWTKAEILDWLYFDSSLTQPPGTKYVYSDLSMITLQQVIEKITEQPLDTFLYNNVFTPLLMYTTQFNPASNEKYRIPPTQKYSAVRGHMIWGEVHDPTAYYMGGVAGNAGLFSTVFDLLKYMRSLLGHDIQIFKKTTIDYWTKVAKLSYENSRALGWDTVPIQTNPPCGHKFSANSFGHTGYTGTSIWADKDKDLSIIILTNRVYPDDKTSVVKFRSDASNLIVDILTTQ